MAVYPVDWSALAGGGSGALCVLVAGYPHPILAPGVSLTAVSWTSDADAAWHVGTSGLTPKAWLDLPTGWQSGAPSVQIVERASPVQQELEISPVYLRLADTSGDVTTLLYDTRSQPLTYLTASLQSGDTTATVESTSAHASSGGLYIGREVLGYTGKTATTFTGLTRGKYGTRAKLHAVVSNMLRPQVYGNATGLVTLPSLKGRRVTLWMLRFSTTATTTAVDPALLFDGRAGAGIELDGAAIRVPVIHAVKSLETKLRQTRVQLAGYHHYGQAGDVWAGRGMYAEGDGELLAVYVEKLNATTGNARLSLTRSDADTGGVAGWTPDAPGFFTRWNARAVTLLSGSPYTITTTTDTAGKLFVWVAGSSADTHLQIAGDWQAETIRSYPDEDPASSDGTPFGWTSRETFPTAWVPLQGASIHLTATDAGQLPTTVTATGGSGIDTGTYRWALEVGSGERQRRLLLSSVDLGASTIYGTLDGPPPARVRDTILTEPTPASLVLRATGESWWGALRYGVFAGMDAWQGHDILSDSFDWTRIRDVARSAGTGIPLARRYTISGGNALREVLQNECALNGLALATYRGRISVARIREASPPEPPAGTITSADLGARPSMMEAADCTASSYKITLSSRQVVRVVDVVAEDEAGGGREITADASAVLADTVSAVALAGSITQLAMGALGPFSRSWRLVTVRTDLRFAGVQLGDVVLLSDWLIPDDAAGRGVSSRACVVMGRRVTLAAPEGTRVELDLLLSGTTLAGYAPEALVVSIAGAVLTLDTTLLGTQGPYGFADELLPSGAARTDGGASTFIAGDKVVLMELDATSPATPDSFTVASVSGSTVTLTSSPSATWTTLVGTPGKVLLAFDGYATVTTGQKAYCYLATTGLVIGSDAARRYAG